MAPEYLRPEAPIPAEWPRGEAYQAIPESPFAADLNRQEFFTDEKLQKVIGIALENNRELRLSAQNLGVDQAAQVAHMALRAVEVRAETPDSDMAEAYLEAAKNILASLD